MQNATNIRIVENDFVKFDTPIAGATITVRVWFRDGLVESLARLTEAQEEQIREIARELVHPQA